jgi:hypothetical protein
LYDASKGQAAYISIYKTAWKFGSSDGITVHKYVRSSSDLSFKVSFKVFKVPLFEYQDFRVAESGVPRTGAIRQDMLRYLRID